MSARGFGNYTACCRLCLAENHDSLKSVFDEAGNSTLAKWISTFLDVTITAEDKVTTMICTPCVNQINSWHTYKEKCASNQQKLNDWLRLWNANHTVDMNVHIKDEPEDPRENLEVVMEDEDEPITVKPEPVESHPGGTENGEETPPSLMVHSPSAYLNGVDHSSIMEVDMIEGDGTIEMPRDSRQCYICSKTFSTPGNRKKHERIIHGIMDNSSKGSMSLDNSEIGSVSQGEDSQHSIDSQAINDRSNLELQHHLMTPTTEADREKIMFAAGLKLQQRNTPQEVVLDANGLTRIELSYIEKCRAMVTMFDTLICACHNAPHKTIKRMFSHLRSQRIWFPIYTCYNCMITFTDRSTSMKHKGLCPRKPLEHLMKLSELRKNDQMKRRLYQIFKCVICKFLFSFYEDYVAHVDAEHCPAEGPFRCNCSKSFNELEEYKDHIHKSCLVDFYCDICFIISSNIDNFEMHCKQVHDISEGFVLLQEDNYQPRTYYHRNPSPFEPQYEPTPPPLPPPQLEIDDEEYSPQRKVFNPSSWKKGKPSPCPVCGRVYSNYHNMLRHLKTHDDSEKTIQCPECPEKFRLNQELKNHRLEEHGNPLDNSREYVFSCPDCGDIHRSLQDWNKHKESHQPQKCTECNKTFTFKTELEQHRTVHLNLKIHRDSKTHAYKSTVVSPSSVVHMCQSCDKVFPTKEELDTHKTIHEEMPVLKAENGLEPEEEKQDLSKKYSCKLCNKHYLGYGGLWDHNKKKHPGRQIAHDYPRKCKYCDKMLYTGGSWVIHKRMHERLMQQQDSGGPSTSQDTPKTSQASEEDNDESESYYTCKRCFKVFSNKYNLKNHMKCHGINTSPTRTQAKSTKQVWCDVCHQACQGLAELEKHKKEHENENMPELMDEEEPENKKFEIFSCDLCGDEFMSKFGLKKHKEAHLAALEKTPLAERPKYVYCRYCKIPFENVPLLNEHMLNEHEEQIKTKQKTVQPKKYTCNLCRKVFDTSGALCSHQGWHKRTKVLERQGGHQQEKVFHKKINPAAIEAQIFQCQRCPSKFGNDTALQIHILERHRNVNATVVPPRCKQCNVEFESTEAYEKHKQLHIIVENSKEQQQQPQQPHTKPNPCKYCPSAFTRADTLSAHVRQFHREQYLLQLKCHVCNRFFEKQNALTVHLKTHDRQKVANTPPVQKALPKGLSCSICQIVFADSKELRNHVFTAHPF